MLIMIVLVIVLAALFIATLTAAVGFRSEIRRKDSEILLLGQEVKFLNIVWEKDFRENSDKLERRVRDLEEEVSKAHGRLGHFLLGYLDKNTLDRDHLDNVRDLFGSKAA